MITDENKYDVIDAYLLGLLHEDGRREVEQKMADDPAFQTEVILQKVLLAELDRQETADTDRLIDQLLAEEAQTGTAPTQTGAEIETETEVPIIPIGQNRQTRWRPQSWQIAAGLVLALGVGWVGYRLAAPPTVVASLTYQQRTFGGFGADSVGQRSQLPVTFVRKLFGEPEYENGPAGLRLYLTTSPGNPAEWLLTDDAGGFRLRTPTGTVYTLLPDTAGERKPLR